MFALRCIVCAIAFLGSVATAWADGSCPFTANDQIAGLIQSNMQTIDSMRAAAQSCTTQSHPPPIVVPGAPSTAADLATVKSTYSAWLNEVALAIWQYSPPPVNIRPPPLTTPTPPGPPSDMPSNYAATSSAASQNMSAYLQNCPGAFSQPNCGTDVNCQRGQAEAVNFQAVGEGLLSLLKNCPEAIRKMAYDELTGHHDWN